MAISYKEDTVSNARIKIDYTGKRPTVKFSYPDKKLQSAVGHANLWSALIAVILSILISVFIRAPQNQLLSGVVAAGLYALVYIIIRSTIGRWIRHNGEQVQIILDDIAKRDHFKRTFREVPKEKYVEIPLFKNIFMDFNAYGQFSKHLKRVEITEHPFKMCSYTGYGSRLKKTNNNTLWRARFYFDAVPQKGKGYLEVMWR